MSSRLHTLADSESSPPFPIAVSSPPPASPTSSPNQSSYTLAPANAPSRLRQSFQANSQSRFSTLNST
ncbi:uncharacterized protein CANTADRAFT_24716 [Suhomyces tanzawaensis NRRL Y-17324]|uniref:Uncharacterized protein n=1 Tax=Suhomyces tanzawaensis NRRL Y-17324 TaxID=984487 RepID=A0A1E4SR98_9ASCO|nr:uncharacterized protein CANTADRAFT_24716 [Suhomyces tanzawaensis NRRL Y-17324]ODV82025.1 hypothetical protein CANTADRAFT_24716 [Suhomyces tanzawaensis NRRL Y-17324]